MGFESPSHWVILIILAALLFGGYKKLPEMSRSVGRSLRIFKTEMKGMTEDDAARDAADQAKAPAPPPVVEQQQIPAAPVAPATPQVPTAAVPPAAVPPVAVTPPTAAPAASPDLTKSPSENS
jgi:sec-independent protein translocase protein TatA